MKTRHIFLALLALVAVFTQSCKKSEGGDNGPTIDNQEVLKTWKVSKAMEGTIDVTAEFTQYRLTLADDGTTKSYTLVDRSGTSTTGSWTLSDDKTSLTITPSSGTAVTFTAVSFNTDQLQYQGTTTGKAGQVTISFTLVPA
jgi:hypothetical protein